MPGHPGLATHEPTARLLATISIAMQCFSASRRVSAIHEQDARAGCPSRVKAARVSLNPGSRPGARPGCPARMPGSCVDGLLRGNTETESTSVEVGGKKA